MQVGLSFWQDSGSPHYLELMILIIRGGQSSRSPQRSVIFLDPGVAQIEN